jgi:acetate---CoA ligase (ADP-forming)
LKRKEPAMLELSRDSGATPGRFDLSGPEPRPQVPSAACAIRDERRRRRATVEAIRHILRPQSLVVIGASRNHQDLGSRIVEGIRIGGFTGVLYVVNAEVPLIQDVRTVASLRDLPRGVDLAVVCVAAGEVLKTVDECGQSGISAVVVLSPGFAECGPLGRLLQDALLDLVRGYGMRLVGPNCLGVVNLERSVRLHAACSPILPAEGGISVASQGGALGSAVLDLAAERELGVSSYVNLGNKADVSSNDLLEYWELDPATRVILLYLESFGNPWRFARIARRVGSRKPIVALKAGRTEAGARSIGPHRSALANDDSVVGAICEQTGVIRVDRIDEMFDIACCLDLQPLPRGRRVAIVTNAAGPGILAADACAMTGLNLAPLNSDTRASVPDLLPAANGHETPGEMVRAVTPPEYRTSLEAVLCDPGVDSVVVVDTPSEAQRSAEILMNIGEAVRAARARGISEKPVLVCAVTRRRRASPIAAGWERLPSYEFPESAVRALARITSYAEWRTRTNKGNKS